MAVCPITLKGISLGCETSKGGIKRAFVAQYGDVASVSVEEGIITGITMTTAAAGAAPKFKEYNFRKGTSSMTSTYNADETTGSRFVSTELSLVFTKMEAAKRLEISALSIGGLVVIVEDNNGKLWYLGYDNYVSASAGSGNTGTAATDSNNYSITLSDESNDYPFPLKDASVLTDIVDFN